MLLSVGYLIDLISMFFAAYASYFLLILLWWQAELI